MPRPLSNEAKRRLNSLSPDEEYVVAIEISHQALVEPARFVNDRQDLISNGKTYVAAAFKLSLIDDKEKELPKAQISFANIGKSLVDWIDRSAGGQGARIRILIIYRKRPDILEVDQECDLLNLSLDMVQINGTLAFDDMLGKPAVNIRYTTKEAPGLI